MRVEEKYVRYLVVSLFALAGLSALLVRGDAWPFAMTDLNLPPHEVQISKSALDSALTEDEYDVSVIRPLSLEILAKDPLSPEPFEAELLLALEEENVDVDMAVALAEATLRRDARNLTARFFLFDQAIIDGNWDRAFDAFGKAITLWPSEAQSARDLMYESLENDEWSAALIDRLKSGEAWIKVFVADMPLDLISTEQAVELHRPFTDLHEQFLRKMINAHGFQDAYDAWAELRPIEAEKHPFGLIDPEFLGNDSARPFNWIIDTKFAEISEYSPGLNIFFRGRSKSMIASQILYLDQGKYWFAMRKSDTGASPPGDIVWQLICMNDGETIMRASVFASEFDDSVGEVEFEVGESCDFQELSLVGLPGQYAERFSLNIDFIAITERAT
jgi:hypothetical protein